MLNSCYNSFRANVRIQNRPSNRFLNNYDLQSYVLQSKKGLKLSENGLIIIIAYQMIDSCFSATF